MYREVGHDDDYLVGWRLAKGCCVRDVDPLRHDHLHRNKENQVITIIAIICSLASPENCKEVQVTSTSYEPLTMSDCSNVPKIVQWFQQRGNPDERLAGWKCQLGSKGRDI